MKCIRCFAGAGLAVVIALLAPNASKAQTLGYISADLNNGLPTLASFSTVTGVVASPFPDGLGGGRTFAVSSDGSTLYVPAEVLSSGTGVLNIVSAATGNILQSVPLLYPASKVLLTGTGAKAWVMTESATTETIVVEAVDLASGTVAGAVKIQAAAIRSLVDIALSPDGTKLFVALYCLGECPTFPTPCTVAKGICIYDTSTLAFESEVSSLSGVLSISQDGNSLYVAPASESDYLYILNTQTLAISKIALPNDGLLAGPSVVSPLGKYAVQFAYYNGSPDYTKAYILDTQTNKLAKTFISSFPGGYFAASGSFYAPGNPAAFTSDGKSIWMALSCNEALPCSLANGATIALAGFAFPSGSLTAVTALTTQTASNRAPTMFRLLSRRC